jgi:hypothetical protein
VYEWAGHSRDESVKLADGAVAREPLLRKVEFRTSKSPLIRKGFSGAEYKGRIIP